jgi:hypothetical protein
MPEPSQCSTRCLTATWDESIRVALTAHLSTGVERRESENILLDGRGQDMGFAGSIHDLLQTVSVVN